MICKNCGAQLPENETRCPNCGTENGAQEIRVKLRGLFSKKNIIIIILAALLVLGGGIAAVVIGASSSVSRNAATGFQLAEKYLLDMNYKQAVIEFQKVLEIEPRNVDAYLGLAEAYIGLGDTEKALEVLREGLELTGDSRLQAKIDELTKPAESSSVPQSSAVPESKPEESEPIFGLMGTVTILGQDYDIATTERLLIYNKTSYEAFGHPLSNLLKDPEAYNSKYPQHAYTVICLNNELSESEYRDIISEVNKFTNLTSLEIDFLGITDISGLTGLTNLSDLNLNFNSINDISVLAGLTNLKHLWLNGNEITDLSPIAGLTKLKSLNFWGSRSTDISPLAGLTNLTYLEWSGDSKDLTPLTGLINLDGLVLPASEIGDLTPLAKLKNLKALHFNKNSISDTDIAWLQEQLPNCEIILK